MIKNYLIRQALEDHIYGECLHLYRHGAAVQENQSRSARSPDPTLRSAPRSKISASDIRSLAEDIGLLPLLYRPVNQPKSPIRILTMGYNKNPHLCGVRGHELHTTSLSPVGRSAPNCASFRFVVHRSSRFAITHR